MQTIVECGDGLNCRWNRGEQPVFAWSRSLAEILWPIRQETVGFKIWLGPKVWKSPKGMLKPQSVVNLRGFYDSRTRPLEIYRFEW